jgi:hypothetical protein
MNFRPEFLKNIDRRIGISKPISKPFEKDIMPRDLNSVTEISETKDPYQEEPNPSFSKPQKKWEVNH